MLNPMKDICVIMPTVRNFSCVREYVDNALKFEFDVNRLYFLLVTEDFCDKPEMRRMLKESGVEGEVFGLSERERWMDENGVSEFTHLIPKRSHAETSFGLLWMRSNMEFRYGIFIDDDTKPHHSFDYFGSHVQSLEFRGNIDELSSDRRWVNVLHRNFNDHRLYPRGYPYSCTGERLTKERVKANNVMLSQGLWTNVPDLDAVRILIEGETDGQSKTRLDEKDYEGQFSIARGNYTTMCSMNLSFRRDIIPCFYQLPMDDNKWKVGRFDDIWSGVLAKKVCDFLGHSILNGPPLCIHNKEKRNIFKDMNAEVPALELNEYLWKIIDNVRLEGDFATCYSRLGQALHDGNFSGHINGDFLNFIGKYMLDWTDCCAALER